MAPPADIVNTLRTGLTAGKLPCVLVLLFPSGGGHAVTPYALYDRGDGQFDIAVYDHYYPLRARAVHVDTNAKPGATRGIARSRRYRAWSTFGNP